MHETIYNLGQDIGDLKHRVLSLEESLGEAIYWARRAGVLISLWALGIVSNISTNAAADFAVEVIKLLIG